MMWIERFRKKLARRRLRQFEKSGKYPRDFVELGNAKKIGIIINVTDFLADDFKQFLEYTNNLQKQNKDLFLIEVNFSRKSAPHFRYTFDSIFINPSKLNWLEYPNTEMVQQIQKRELDILINFDQSLHPTSKYLCSVANAKTRTGIHQEGFESCYELMIEQEGTNQMQHLIQTFDGVLNMIKK